MTDDIPVPPKIHPCKKIGIDIIIEVGSWQLAVGCRGPKEKFFVSHTVTANCKLQTAIFKIIIAFIYYQD